MIRADSHIPVDSEPDRDCRRFATEWTRYPDIIPQYESLFRSWTPSLEPEDFRGKRVLDAGCGTGRNSHWALSYGAASVTAIDATAETCAVAQRNLGGDPRATVEVVSIYDLGYVSEFDLAFCIGVLHHLKEPRRALEILLRSVKDGGTLAVWVYAREGFTRAKLLLDAVRRITCRVPASVLNVAVFPFSLIAFAATRLAPRSQSYAKHLRRSPFWQIHSILYDQLLPEVAHYWSAEDLKTLFAGLPIKDLDLRFVNGGSWAISCTKTHDPS